MNSPIPISNGKPLKTFLPWVLFLALLQPAVLAEPYPVPAHSHAEHEWLRFRLSPGPFSSRVRDTGVTKESSIPQSASTSSSARGVRVPIPRIPNFPDRPHNIPTPTLLTTTPLPPVQTLPRPPIQVIPRASRRPQGTDRPKNLASTKKPRKKTNRTLSKSP